MEKDEKIFNVAQEGIGSVQIADEVVAVIVAIAATEVEVESGVSFSCATRE